MVLLSFRRSNLNKFSRSCGRVAGRRLKSENEQRNEHKSDGERGDENKRRNNIETNKLFRYAIAYGEHNQI